MIIFLSKDFSNWNIWLSLGFNTKFFKNYHSQQNNAYKKINKLSQEEGDIDDKDFLEFRVVGGKVLLLFQEES